MKDKEKPRRKINELIALYELEPSLRELFVEGATDKELYSWYLQFYEIIGSSCRMWISEIDDIEVPKELYYKNKFPSLLYGRKGQLVCLAIELALVECDLSERVLCIVDRDYDDSYEASLTNELLIRTDFNSIECYALTDDVLDKFIAVCLGGYRCTGRELLAAIAEPLQSLYSGRCALRAIAPHVPGAKAEGCIEINSPVSIKYDRNKWIFNSLNKCGEHGHYDGINASAENYDISNSSDTRLSVRGHDIEIVLSRVFRKYPPGRKAKFGHQETLRAALLGCLERELLDRYPLFQLLRVRFGGCKVERVAKNN